MNTTYETFKKDNRLKLFGHEDAGKEDILKNREKVCGSAKRPHRIYRERKRNGATKEKQLGRFFTGRAYAGIGDYGTAGGNIHPLYHFLSAKRQLFF